MNPTTSALFPPRRAVLTPRTGGSSAASPSPSLGWRVVIRVYANRTAISGTGQPDRRHARRRQRDAAGARRARGARGRRGPVRAGGRRNALRATRPLLRERRAVGPRGIAAGGLRRRPLPGGDRGAR